ncbi:Lipoprotein signal peptidase [Azospirillaceae bacterium]
MASIAFWKKHPLSFGVWASLTTLVLDQTSKFWILSFFEPTSKSPILPRMFPVTSFFNLVLTWNRGVSFGLFAHDSRAVAWTLAGLAVGLSVLLFVWLSQAERLLPAIGLGLVIGGALGNAIDRLRFGAVTDFLDFHLADVHFWAFNVADSGISIGVALIVIDSLVNHSQDD